MKCLVIFAFFLFCFVLLFFLCFFGPFSFLLVLSFVVKLDVLATYARSKSKL